MGVSTFRWAVSAPDARDGRSSRRRRRAEETGTAWAYVFPSALIILGLGILPVAWSFLLSLQKSDLLTPPVWAGMQNYTQISKDPAFRSAVWHTIVYTALFVPLSIAAGLALALLLNRRIRFIGVYRTLVFVPFVISATAQGVLFSFIFDSHFGLANAILHGLHLPSQGFFADQHQALFLLVIIALWSGVGFCVVVYLAGLQDVRQELVEAAALDGAGHLATFRYVIWPSLRPITVFLLVWNTLQSLQVFDIVFVTTRGGPLQSTTVVVFFVWQQAFELFNAGYAAAGAYVLALALLVLSIFIRFAGRRDDDPGARRRGPLRALLARRSPPPVLAPVVADGAGPARQAAGIPARRAAGTPARAAGTPTPRSAAGQEGDNS